MLVTQSDSTMAIARRGFPWGPGGCLQKQSTRRDRPGSWLAPCGDTSFAGGPTPSIHVLYCTVLFSGILWGVSEVVGWRGGGELPSVGHDAMLLARELSHIEAIPASGADVGVDM